MIGDISLASRGPISPHVSHQSGRDIDTTPLVRNAYRVAASTRVDSGRQERAMDLTSTIVASASLLLGGCLSGLVPDAESGTSSGGTTGTQGTDVTGPSPGSSGSPPGGTSAAETANGSTLGTSSGPLGDSSSGSDSGSGGSVSVCPDEGDRRTASISFSGAAVDEQGWENVDAMCFVAGFEEGEGTSEYALECDEGGPEPTQRVLFAPPISALGVGMTVRLRYLRQDVIDGRFYWAFALHDLEGTLVMGNYRNRLPSNAPTDPATFFAPFEFTPVKGLCPPEPPEDDEDGGFISDPCPFVRTPFGVSVALGDQTTTVLDGTVRSVSGYEFNVSAFVAEFVDPESICPSDGELVSLHIFSEE